MPKRLDYLIERNTIRFFHSEFNKLSDILLLSILCSQTRSADLIGVAQQLCYQTNQKKCAISNFLIFQNLKTFNIFWIMSSNDWLTIWEEYLCTLLVWYLMFSKKILYIIESNEETSRQCLSFHPEEVHSIRFQIAELQNIHFSLDNSML